MYSACIENNVAYRMKSRSFSTNHISSPASDTAMRAPNASAIVRARIAPSAKVACKVEAEKSNDCASSLSVVTCAYRGCPEYPAGSG